MPLLLSSASDPPWNIVKLIKVQWTPADLLVGSCYEKKTFQYEPRLWQPQSKPFSPHHNKSSYSDTTTSVLSCADREGGSQPLFNKIVPSRTVLLLKLFYYILCRVWKAEKLWHGFFKTGAEISTIQENIFSSLLDDSGRIQWPYIHLQADHILTNVSLQTPLGWHFVWERNVFMFSLFVTHIWTKFFSQMLNRDICLNVQLWHSFLLQRTPIWNSSFFVIYFELYVFIGVNLKCCYRTNSLFLLKTYHWSFLWLSSLLEFVFLQKEIKVSCYSFCNFTHKKFGRFLHRFLLQID